ncbi:hypothetical protein KSS87_020622 [Heliosperma pusillum]|nr:hypothetical protein KSS87_020622 [Heliosperma pusillum]
MNRESQPMGQVLYSGLILPFHYPPLQHCCRFLQATRWPTVGKYYVDVASFERVVLPELQIHEDTDLFVIDEVGKMELYSSSFLPAVLRLLDSNIPILASIPVIKHGRDIPGVERIRNHPGATLYMLNPSNRDEFRERVYSKVVDLLSKH